MKKRLNKIKPARVFLWTAFAALLTIIFILSAMPRADSDSLSLYASSVVGGTTDVYDDISGSDVTNEDIEEYGAETETPGSEREEEIKNHKIASSVVNRKSPGFVKYIQRHIREIAHMVIFFLLGIISYLLIYYESGRIIAAYPFSLLFVVAAAVLDELHQHFVPGRAMEAEDIIRDVAAAAVGITLTFAICAVVRKVKTKKGDK